MPGPEVISCQPDIPGHMQRSAHTPAKHAPRYPAIHLSGFRLAPGTFGDSDPPQCRQGCSGPSALEAVAGRRHHR
jgi:hypothetical protein